MKKTDNLKMNFDKSCQSMGELKIDFLNFTNHCVENSQMYNYFENFLNMVELIHDLVAADREGDWEAHLLVVQNILPIFRELFNYSINYLRYGSLYLENMRRKPEEHPEIYTKFMQCHEVKQRYGSLNGVAGDMKLEQTIQ